MFVLGVTGSIGSGKSTVARMIHEITGAPIVDADAIVHRQQQPGQPGLRALVAQFGTSILREDGSLDRPALGAIVFKSPEMRSKLDALIHPLVRAEERRELDQAQAAGKPMAILEVPLLYENGLDTWCNAVVVVTVSPEERYRRLQARSGLTRAQVDARLAAQMPDFEKISRATYVIENSGSIDDTRRLVEKLCAGLPVVE